MSESLCICTEVAKTVTRLKVVLERRKWGKQYTIVQGLDSKEFNLKDMAKRLRSKLACGGTVKDENIELQGNHKFRIVNLLEDMGFDRENVDVITK